jgi:uncharacterized protein involved in exopolysaccharide biosynthesis
MSRPETEARRAPVDGHELDVEQEVDLGRYWHALAVRWWLPLAGIVVGALIGIAASTGGSRPYQAETIVYLGQPFAPGSTAPLQNLPTRLATVSEQVRSRALVRRVAGRVGVSPGRLRAGISTEVIAGLQSGRIEQPSPLVALRVKLPSAATAVRADNLLANAVVRGFSTFVDAKLRVYQQQQVRAQRELGEIERRIAAATDQQQRLLAGRLSLTEQLVLLANVNNVLQFSEQRRASLETTLLSVQQQIAQAKQIERARVFEPAAATRLAAPSKRTGAVVGALIGLIVGAVAALLWDPVSRRVRTRPAAA